jgi:DNA-binding transcriptional MerR regulator
MRIGELAKSVGVGVETVRYYQRIGLLEAPQKPFGVMRSYSIKDLQKLRFIRRAQQLGFLPRRYSDVVRAFELRMRASPKTRLRQAKGSSRKARSASPDRNRPREHA